MAGALIASPDLCPWRRLVPKSRRRTDYGMLLRICNTPEGPP